MIDFSAFRQDSVSNYLWYSDGLSLAEILIAPIGFRYQQLHAPRFQAFWALVTVKIQWAQDSRTKQKYRAYLVIPGETIVLGYAPFEWTSDERFDLSEIGKVNNENL